MHQPVMVVNTSPQTAALIHLRRLNELGRTARQLGAEIGMEHSTVSRWIRGERVPTGKGLQKLLEWSAKNGGQPVPIPEGMPATTFDAIALAKAETAVALAELERVHAYAKTVHQMLQNLTDTQKVLLDKLAPWVGDDLETMRLRSELDAVSQRAETTPPASATPRRKAKGR